MQKTINLFFVALAFFTLTHPAFSREPNTFHRVGVIMTGTPKDHGNLVPMLRQGLQALGYVEGRNFILEPRYDMRDRSRLQKLAEELLELKVKVIVVTGAAAARAARRASPKVPIVVAVAGDLVGSGLVASLSKPGGNITGNTAFSGALSGKQLQLLKEAIPTLKRVAVLHSRTGVGNFMVAALKSLKEVAPTLGVEILDVGLEDRDEFEGAFAAMARAKAQALIIFVSRVTSVHRKELIERATKQNLALMCWRPSMARNGCLLSYGADRNAMYRHAATFVHKILKGAKPGDLPVQQPTKFGLAVNLKTAKALGITLPQSILLRAEEVIE